MFNLRDEEKQPAPVTLPRFNLPEVDRDADIREAARAFATQRTIRLGRDALDFI